MKHQIFGRPAGTTGEMKFIVGSDEDTFDVGSDEPGVVHEHWLTHARGAVQALQDHGIEGYVLFEDDPTQYPFTLDAGFVYPATCH